MRHVVQRGVELAGQRRFALKLEVSALTKMACRLRLMPFRPMKNSTSSTPGRCSRSRHAAPAPATSARRPAGCAYWMIPGGRNCGPRRRGVADRHGDAEHVRDRIVVAENGDEAPDAEHGGIEHRADRVARLPMLRLLERQHRGAPFVFAHLERADRADPMIRTAHGHSRTLPVLSAVMTARRRRRRPSR